jgi:hypothetical protein
VQPVEGVDRHDVPVGQLVEERPEEPRDVREALRVVGVVVVVVPNVVDERDDPLPPAREEERLEESLVAADDGQIGGVRLRPIPVRRHRKGGRLLRIHVLFELVHEVVDVRLRDLRPDAVSTVTRREQEIVRDPDLDVRPDAHQREVLEVDPVHVVESEPRPSRAKGRRLGS